MWFPNWVKGENQSHKIFKHGFALDLLQTCYNNSLSKLMRHKVVFVSRNYGAILLVLAIVSLWSRYVVFQYTCVANETGMM